MKFPFQFSLPRLNLFSSLVDHQEYTEYTDAYGRPEIEMMKNSVGNHDLLSQEENKENQLSSEHNKKQKQPNNWYLLYLSGKEFDSFIVHDKIYEIFHILIKMLTVFHHILMQILLQFL